MIHFNLSVSLFITMTHMTFTSLTSKHGKKAMFSALAVVISTILITSTVPTTGGDEIPGAILDYWDLGDGSDGKLRLKQRVYCVPMRSQPEKTLLHF